MVYLWPNLDSVPSLCNAVTLMARRGYHVDIFTYSGPGYPPAVFDEPGVETIVLRTDAPLKRARHTEWETSAAEISLLRARHAALPYVCFMGVDPEGLARAGAMAGAFGLPVLYYSLELLLSSEIDSPWLERLKSREIALSRDAALVVIQDEVRAESLIADNGIARSKLALVPNAPTGPARRRRADHWHRRFGLASESRVVLHAGSIASWTGIGEIAASADSWPPGWVLVVHSRSEAASDGDAAGLRTAAQGGRVFPSLQPVPRREYDDLVDSADVGVAFYVPTGESAYSGDNIRNVGLSSGKLAYYLRSGLPVVVNESGLLADFVREHRCGVAVGDAAGIADAIDGIVADYDGYSLRACRAFDLALDFAGSFEAVFRRMESFGRH